MTPQEIWEFVGGVGLGGMGWILFYFAARELERLRDEYVALLKAQKEEAVAQAKLLEQRLFDLKSAITTKID